MSDLIPVGAVPCACPVQGDHKGAPLRNDRPNVTLPDYLARDTVRALTVNTYEGVKHVSNR